MNSADGQGAEEAVRSSFEAPRFDWSPDGKWIVYAKSDDDFNEDIWVLPVDGSRPPFNLSRHPDNEGNPTWSPDGKMIAFTGRRADTEVDIYFVYLREDEDEKTTRDRSMEKAHREDEEPARTGGVPPAVRGSRKAVPRLRKRMRPSPRPRGVTPKNPTLPPMPPAEEPKKPPGRGDRLRPHPRADSPRLDPRLDRDGAVLVERLEEAGLLPALSRVARGSTRSSSPTTSGPSC